MQTHKIIPDRHIHSGSTRFEYSFLFQHSGAHHITGKGNVLLKILHDRTGSIIIFLLAGILMVFGNGCSTGGSKKNKIKPVLSIPQAIVDAGNAAPLIRYNRNIRGGAHTDGAFTGGWQITHALAVRDGDPSVDAKLLEQIVFNLQGRNTISANGGYPAQHERHMTGAYAIIRYVPRFWEGALNEEQRHKIDLLMKASLIASAYTTSDALYTGAQPVTALDGDANLNRDWNPNYREGMIGGMLVATVYFGGVEKVYDLLNRYDHEEFITRLRVAGLDNIYETFTWKSEHPDSKAPSGEQIERIIHDYRYKGKPLMNPMDLYYYLAGYTYGKDVTCGLNGGRGIEVDGISTGTIVSGCESLPNKGKPGMLLEFDGKDAGGPRSSIIYAYDGFRPNLTNHVVVLAGGYWKAGDQENEILRLMNVGITDLEYKLKHGYRNYSKGHGSAEINGFGSDMLSWSYKTTLPLWEDVIKPYHQRSSR